jgi:hypothetical protein
MDKEKAAFCKFLHSEMKKIDIDKWHEGERINNDPGQPYIVEWIGEHAKEFREQWDGSICRFCKNWKECGYKVKKNCEKFVMETESE